MEEGDSLMKKWYAYIVNWQTGKGLELGAWSKEALLADLEQASQTGFIDGEHSSIKIYTVDC